MIRATVSALLFLALGSGGVWQAAPTGAFAPLPAPVPIQEVALEGDVDADTDGRFAGRAIESPLPEIRLRF